MQPGSTKADLESELRDQSVGTSGFFIYLDAGGEQTVVELTPTTRILILGVWLDLTTMTEDGTVKAYYKIDGANYKEFSSTDVTAAGLDGIYLAINAGIAADFKVTYTEGADEGATRNIAYSVVYQELE